MEPSFTVIGLTDSRNPWLTPEALEAIASGHIFSGGRRHHEIVADILPRCAEWIDIVVPLVSTLEKYRHSGGHIVVFASGDPLFYGFAATLLREFPGVEIKVIGAPNSLQHLARRLNIPYQDMRAVSLTGRPWRNLDDALIAGDKMIGVLTDRRHTPDAIARRMIEYGYTDYSMAIGELLGNEESERAGVYSLDEAAAGEWMMPNCVILRRTDEQRCRPWGIPDSEFECLEGRAGMITKMPYRLTALSMLDLPGRSHLWDIGFCTGSVSIEARLRFPRLGVTAFERREESRRLMDVNMRRFGAPGIEAVIGDFMEVDLSSYPRPDAVFIGGHGGRLEEMLGRLAGYMLPGATVVFNSVSEASAHAFERGAADCGLDILETHRLTLDNYNPVTIFKAILR